MKGWCPECEKKTHVQREEGIGTDYICTTCKTSLSLSMKNQFLILPFTLAVLWLIVGQVVFDREGLSGIEIAAVLISIPPFALYAFKYLVFERTTNTH